MIMVSHWFYELLIVWNIELKVEHENHHQKNWTVQIKLILEKQLAKEAKVLIDQRKDTEDQK